MTIFSKPFDAYEVHGCRPTVGYSEEPPHFIECMEQCDDADAEIWSLYGHITGEGLHCIADFTSLEDAEAVLELIKQAEARRNWNA